MKKLKLTPAMIQTKYRAAIQSYARQLSDLTLRLEFTQQADGYFRRCARYIWQGCDEVTQAHVDAYNAIYSGENEAARTLFFELALLVDGAPAFAPPAFYADLVRSGRRENAAQFIELCRVLLRMFAMVGNEDGSFDASRVEYCLACLRQESGQNIIVPPAPAPPADNGGNTAAQTTQEAQQQQAQSEELPRENVEDLLAELDALCGLEQVKKDVRSLINLVKVRRLRAEQGLTVPPMSLHVAFLGNPGTGKTTVARLLARLYHAIGVLSKGHLVETDRSGLVAGYVGQTAIKTQEVITSAMGGVLFIDEAYSMISKEGANDFGHEAIEILLKNMEDHRDDLIVIVAGYTDLMQQFIHSNPGLESRFNKCFYFEDYTAEQLLHILLTQCERNSYTLSEQAQEKAAALLQQAYEGRDENFGNARDVRNLFEKLISAQSDRVAMLEEPTKEDLMLLTAEDFDAAEQTDAASSAT